MAKAVLKAILVLFGCILVGVVIAVGCLCLLAMGGFDDVGVGWLILDAGALLGFLVGVALATRMVLRAR